MRLYKDEIRRILPHREPLLLIDSALLEPGKSVQADVYADPAWDVFRGHFPNEPILPGIYITESMAQAASILLLTLPGQAGKLPLFAGISGMRFLRPIHPGDSMQLTASIHCDAGNGLFDCSVQAFLQGKRAANGIITLALSKL